MGRVWQRHGRLDPRAACLAFVLASAVACSGGGGGGSSSDPPPDAAALSAEVEWAPASGPVAGYRVAVSRDEEPFVPEQNVTGPRATIRGEPGETIRIRVAAYDRNGNLGPESPPSQPIAFTDSSVEVADAGDDDPGVGGGTADTPPGTPPSEGGDGEPPADGGTDDPADTPDDPQEPGDEPSEPPVEEEPPVETTDLAPGVLLTPGLDVAATLARFDAPTAAWTLIDAGDLDGNGVEDLLWIIEGAYLGASLLDGATDEPPFAGIAMLESGWTLLAVEDLDADGRADLLWREDASGALAVSHLGPDGVLAPVTVPLAETAGSAVLVGDFDGDGAADLLLDDAASGAAVLRRSAATGEVVSEALPLPVAEGSVRVDVGDYDGDGRSDLLWREPSGNLTVTFMAGTEAEALLEVQDSAALEVLHSADFDGDGVDEILYHDGATGMPGMLGLVSRVGPAEWVEPLDAGAEWQLATVGDFDGDGVSDLAWTTAR